MNIQQNLNAIAEAVATFGSDAYACVAFDWDFDHADHPAVMLDELRMADLEGIVSEDIAESLREMAAKLVRDRGTGAHEYSNVRGVVKVGTDRTLDLELYGVDDDEWDDADDDEPDEEMLVGENLTFDQVARQWCLRQRASTAQ